MRPRRHIPLKSLAGHGSALYEGAAKFKVTSVHCQDLLSPGASVVTQPRKVPQKYRAPHERHRIKIWRRHVLDLVELLGGARARRERPTVLRRRRVGRLTLGLGRQYRTAGGSAGGSASEEGSASAEGSAANCWRLCWRLCRRLCRRLCADARRALDGAWRQWRRHCWRLALEALWMERGGATDIARGKIAAEAALRRRGTDRCARPVERGPAARAGASSSSQVGTTGSHLQQFHVKTMSKQCQVNVETLSKQCANDVTISIHPAFADRSEGTHFW